MKPAMKADDEDKSNFFDAFDLDSTVSNAKADSGVSIASLFDSFFRAKSKEDAKDEHQADE